MSMEPYPPPRVAASTHKLLMEVPSTHTIPTTRDPTSAA